MLAKAKSSEAAPNKKWGLLTEGNPLTTPSTCSPIFLLHSSLLFSPSFISSTAFLTSIKSFSTSNFCSSSDLAKESVEVCNDKSKEVASSYFASSAV